jgi:tRNA nucleotidyltransferase/poly(A) polymerase
MTALRDAAGTIVRRLRDAGFEAVLAGGCVRDRLLGLEPSEVQRLIESGVLAGAAPQMAAAQV